MTAPLASPHASAHKPEPVWVRVTRFWARLLHTLQHCRGQGGEWVAVNVRTGEVAEIENGRMLADSLTTFDGG